LKKKQYKGFFSPAVVSTRAPQSDIAQCGACGLFERCKTPKMEVFGEGKHRVLFVGEHPTHADDAAGRPFSGDEGDLLRSACASAGVNLDDCMMTNAVICAPPKTLTDKDKKIIGYCAPNLRQAVIAFQPDVIIPMGFIAAKSYLSSYYKDKVGGIKTWAGWQIPMRKPNVWVCPTFSPTFVIESREDRNGDVVELLFRDHIKQALSKSAQPWDQIPDYSEGVRIIMNPDDAAAEIRKMIAKGLMCSWDLETTSLKPEAVGARILTCAITQARHDTISFPVIGEAKKALSEFCASPVPKVGANTKFEDRWSRVHLGTPVNNWVWDTVLSAHHLDNRPNITSVKFQAFVRLGMEAWEESLKVYMKADNSMSLNKLATVDLPVLLKYNGLDSVIEFEIALHQRAEMMRMKELACK
jgi:uracil-DNA glycosylase family 4